MPAQGRVQQLIHHVWPAEPSSDREDIYDAVHERIGDTPFVEVKGLDFPRGCRLWAKEEYRNPTGSHYDREMWRFLHELELSGHIVPSETKMLETTTGNSGAAFSWLCRVLGFPSPIIIIPEDMPQARIAQIKSYGADVVLSRAGQYITGISEKFQELWDELVVDGGYYPPMHWNDENHCVAAMAELGTEILGNAESKNVEFDYFMLALGNGGSARGIAPVLKKRGVKIIGVEPAESQIIAEFIEKRPTGKWETDRDHRPHGILGTGPFQPSEIYRNMRYVAENGFLDEIMHPSTDDALAQQRVLMDRSAQHVGMSSAAVVWAVREYIQKHKSKKKSFGVIFYDPAWKYL